jgi:hypothetical protein
MEFFKMFMELYNNINSNKEFIKIIPPTEEEWIKFHKNLEKTKNEKKEQLYLMILHYHFLQEKKMEILPYTLKQKGDSIHIPYSELPCVLQHMLIEFI